MVHKRQIRRDHRRNHGPPVPFRPGTVTITAKDRKTGETVATKTFKVLLRASRISVEPETLTLYLYDAFTLNASLRPGNSTDVVKFFLTIKTSYPSV